MRSIARRRTAGWATLLILTPLAVVAALSFLPLIETNVWWVRYADFPRLQLAGAILLLLTAFCVAAAAGGLPDQRRAPWTDHAMGIVLLSGVAALGYHAWTLHPYSGLPAFAAGLTVMAANVRARNEDAAPFLRLVEEADPDVLLVMETDAWWDRRLASLGQRYPERAQHIPDDKGAFGMHILSKRPLVSPTFRFPFDTDTPTLFTGIALADGTVARFVGLHPQPPLAWSQPTTTRDAHILIAALAARSDATQDEPGLPGAGPAIVAGDFNAVPWERVTRRAARIGGLLDPRIGHGFLASFEAGSRVIRWPLDQILFQNGFRALGFATLPPFGSDHEAVLARLCHAPETADARPAPEPLARDLKEARASIEAARRLDQGDPR